jgi:TMEM175 potassium channel family protein
MPRTVRDSPGLTETDRLETFCDGVFAIAITLLVLEIRGPSEQAVAEAGGLFPALARLWPSYLGYVISFLTLGIMWANHHSIFEYVRRADRNFLMINVLFLMCVSFLPFPTHVLADHLADPHERPAAVAFYSATLFVIALAYNAVWRYAVASGRLLGPEADPGGMRTISRRYLVGPLGYGLSFVLAFVSPWTSLALHVLLAALFALPERKPVSRQTRSAAAT